MRNSALHYGRRAERPNSRQRRVCAACFRSCTNTLFGLLILLSQMLRLLLVIPFYVIYRQSGVYNSLAGIADTVFVLPLSIPAMKGFFESIPNPSWNIRPRLMGVRV